MDRHQNALLTLIRELVEVDPVCSVFAVGSIGRGDYRPDSDMDINVVSWQYQHIPRKLSLRYSQELVNWEGVRLDEGYVDGIKTHLNCSTPQNYQNLIMGSPVWRWGGSRILYDPSGIAEWGERCVQQFFADNPEIAEACRRFHDEYIRHKRNKTLPRPHQTQEEFVRSLDLSKTRITYKTFASRALDDAARNLAGPRR